MSENQESSGWAGLPSKIQGKTFILVRPSPDDSVLGETARLLALLGAEVVRDVAPSLDYLVVLNNRPGRLTEEERQANALNERGAAIQILDWSGFRDLLSPTPEEALALLRGGDEGLDQWRLRRALFATEIA